MNVDASSKAEFELIINENQASWLSDLYENRLEADFTIVIADKVIHGHRIILSAAIPYFNSSASIELGGNEDGKVVLENIDPDATEMIIEYVYTGKLKINRDNWQALLSAADFFQHQKIMDHCCDYLRKYFDFDSLFQIKHHPIFPNLPKLIKIVDDYIYGNFEGLSKRKEFLELPFDELMKIVSRNQLRSPSELSIFTSVMNWVKHDLQDRKPNLAQLFKEIRLHLIIKEDLIKFVSRERIITSDEECNEYLYRALSYHILPGERINSRELWARKRYFGEETIYIVGWSRERHRRPMIEKLKLEPFSSVRKDMPDQISFDTTALLSDKLYMIGGGTGKDITRRVWVFDPCERGYLNVAPLNVAREGSGAASIGDNIYVCGGKDQNGASLNSVECFNPAKNKWMMKSPMKLSRVGLSLVVLDGNIYAIGGFHSIVEKYDPVEDNWTMIPPMTIDRGYAGAAVHDGKIFVSGGFSADKAEVYDPALGEWALIPPMIQARHHHHIVNYQSRLFAIGGKNTSDSDMNSIEELEPIGDSWRWSKVEQKVSIPSVVSIQVVRV